MTDHHRATPVLLATSDLNELKHHAASLPAWTLDDRQLCDLELLLNGGFAPLEGFLDATDYACVLATMRLASGALWPLPVVLDVDAKFAERIDDGAQIALCDGQGVALAIMQVSSRYSPDPRHEAQAVFGTGDPMHPGVAELTQRRRPVCLAGPLRGLALPTHYDFASLRHTPAQLRAHFAAQGAARVVAFQTRNPLHRAHFELTRQAAESLDAALLLHPVVGRTKPGDIDHYTRVRCYQALLPRYTSVPATLSLLPLAMRMGGPREALWHALIRRNYGATHFIVGRDHAGPGSDASGKPFYPPLAAQELVLAHAEEIGIGIAAFPAMVYARNRQTFVRADQQQAADEIADVSGTELRRMLLDGEEIPIWFSFPEVAQVLKEAQPERARRGWCVFLTGLSGAGKSTIAQALAARLQEHSARPVTVLDGDEVRKHLSKGLGFSREDRDTNVARIGWVASEIVRHGGVVICAQIAPFASARAQARRLVEAHGRFFEIHVATPLSECERRDRKGLYALARAGELKQFTGISDPYEVPLAPELTLDTLATDPLDEADAILALIRARL